MRAIITVAGHDRVGIIGEVCTLLSSVNVNILDINQTVMQEFFTMTMLVDTSTAKVGFDSVKKALKDKGEAMALAIHIQREDIFNAMHRI